MTYIETHLLTPSNVNALSPSERYQTYCGLDTMVTLEVLLELLPKLPPSNPVYTFERAMQGPYLELMLRGMAINSSKKQQAIRELQAQLAQITNAEQTGVLDELALAVWGKPLNPNSPKQLQDFFYKTMDLPPVIVSKKGVKKVSTDREALEKLDMYLYARPFINCILLIRDIVKQLSVFEAPLDIDGRFRSSYNIAGTESGRPSSSGSAFGTGGNHQNIKASLRYIFEADPGHKMVVIDLEQVEARDVGFICGCLFDDWSFLDACESGDLHTMNAKRIWPDKEWPNTSKGDRDLAEATNFYRNFSLRDMAKRGSHLTNYMGTPWTAGKSLKVPQAIMEEFQARYCKGRYNHKTLPDITPAYPAIPRWWQWTSTLLQSTSVMVTPFGRVRQFFGRPKDDTTLREAIANLPQSTTADRMNLAMLRVWEGLPHIQLLAQTFDSITFQVPDSYDFDATISEALKLIESVVLTAPNGRQYSVPGEAKIGWNWAAASPSNPEGLIKWKPRQDTRVRVPRLSQRIFG